MESKATMKNGRYKGATTVLKLEDNQLIFCTKSLWIRSMFGVLGEAMVSAKERFRINIYNVTCLKITETWTGKPIYEFVTSDNTYKVMFKEDNELSCFLKNALKNVVVLEKE